MRAEGIPRGHVRWFFPGLLWVTLCIHGRAMPAPAAPALHPELALQVGHSGPVLSLAFSPDGRFLTSGGLDQTVRVWDLRTQTLVRTDQETAHVSFVGYTKGGSMLAAVTHWAQLTLKDPATGTPRDACVFLHNITASAVSPDGTWCAAGAENGTFTPIYLPTWQQWYTHASAAPVLSLAFSPDAAHLAIGCEDGSVRFFDTGPKTLQPHVLRHDGAVRAVAFSPDGSTLAAGSGRRQGEVRLWSLPSRRLIRVLKGGVGPVTSLAFTPDGRTLAVGTFGAPESRASLTQSTMGQVDVWDAGSGKLRYSLPVAAGGVRAVAVSPDGRLVAAGGDDTTIRVWDIAGGVPRAALAGYSGSFRSLALAPDGHTLASGCDDGHVRLWNVDSGELLRGWRAHPGPVRAVAFSPDGRLLACGGEERAARLYDAVTGKPGRVLDGHAEHVWSLAFSPDSRWLATGSYREVRLWDTRTGKLRRVLQGHPDYIQSLVFSPDSRTLFSGSRDRRGSETTDEELLLWDVASGRRTGELHPGGSWVRSLVFSPDGATLGIGTERAQLWDTQAWRLRVELDGSRGEALAFSPNGRIVATAVAGGSGVAAGMKLWDAGTGALLQELSNFGQAIRSIVFLPDARRVVGGSDDATIRMWDVPGGKPLVTFLVAAPDPAPPIPAGARPLAADSKALDAGHLGTLAQENYLVVTPEGYYSGPAGADRYVRFRLGDGLFPAECFQDRYYRPHLVKDALHGGAMPPVGTFHGAYPPLACFTSPQEGDEVHGDTLMVTVRATDDSRIARVDVIANGSRVDGRPIAADSKPIPADSKPLAVAGATTAHNVQHEVTLAVPLPVDEKAIILDAIAYDDDGLQSPRARVRITRQTAPGAKGRLLALCVGVSRYEDGRLNLGCADADATALAGVFARQRDVYDTAEAHVLVNEQATRRAVEDALAALARAATRSDTVVLFLSGHGWRSGEGEFYFATHDVDRHNIAGTALPWGDVVRQLRALSGRSRQVIVLLDACHSGTAGSATNDELVQAALRANTGVRILASSRGSELSQELRTLRHGAFTQALLEGLQGKAAADRRTVTLAGLVVYVARRVSDLTGDQQHPYIPLLQDFDPSTVLATVRR